MGGRSVSFFDAYIANQYIKLSPEKVWKVILGQSYADDIDALAVETQITPFSINDDKDTIENLTLANGNKPLMSQRESIEQLGWSDNVDKTLEEITNESKLDAFNLTE